MPRFSFGTYQILKEHIIEIMADDHSELDIPEANECLTLYKTLGKPLGILVNRHYKYSASLEFIMSVAEAPEVTAFAILVEDERAAMVADSQKLFFNNPFKIFYERSSALNWLQQQLTEEIG